MFLIQEVLVSDDVIEKKFCCDLSVCKGACCWKGDYGAPLEPEEIEIIQGIINDVKPFLNKDSLTLLDQNGFYQWYDDLDTDGTKLHSNGACIFMTEENGIAKCGIEKSFEEGKIDFQKPISCHLYPIRITKNKEVNFEAANYSQWDICAPGRKKGMEIDLALSSFLQESIVRKYGDEFYLELAAAVQEYGNRTDIK